MQIRRRCITIGRAWCCDTCSCCNQTFKGPLTKQTFSASCLVTEQASKQSEGSSMLLAKLPVSQGLVSGLQTCWREQLCCNVLPPHFRISRETEVQSSVIRSAPFFLSSPRAFAAVYATLSAANSHESWISFSRYKPSS